MTYVGMYSQIQQNNMKSIFLLISFPVIILGMVWTFLAALSYFSNGYYDAYGEFVNVLDINAVNDSFINAVPWVVGIVGIWFTIAYFSNASMVRSATGARTLERRENPRVYNIVENLTMTCGMDMPKINIIDDPQLNAFASGIDKSSYTVTVTTGLLNLLNDEELAGVIGHELTHIRNHDTRLLITSIIFVGILSTLTSMVVNMLYRTFIYGSFTNNRSRDEKNQGAGILVMLVIAAVICFVGYFFTIITRFAISRKREYMADAGGAELCGNPLALASALRKISGDPGLQHVDRDDVAQLFIVRPKSMAQGFMSAFSGLFATHPDIKKRIKILEQF